MVGDTTVFLNVPAHIWTGSHAVLVRQVEEQLRRVWCAQKGCNNCYVCVQITERQHHAVKWVAPEKQYKVEQINEIIHAASFLLQDDQYFFFVIQKAELLTHVCANRLLKLLEEPPKGYFFLLLVEHEDLLLETVKSRCLIKRYSDEVSTVLFKDMLQAFTSLYGSVLASDFIKMVERSGIDERHSVSLCEQILTYWHEQKRNALARDDNQLSGYAHSVLSIVEKQIQKLPVVGSSKLFWLNFFLQMHAS